MRAKLLNVNFGALGMLAVAAKAHQFPYVNHTSCAAATTVYVTTPGIPTTVYVTVPDSASSSRVKPTTTVITVATHYSTLTKLIPASSTTITAKGVERPGSVSSSNGVYSFYVESGITVWVGATPTATYTDIVVVTKAITVWPTPSSELDSTSTSTVQVSSTVKHTLSSIGIASSISPSVVAELDETRTSTVHIQSTILQTIRSTRTTHSITTVTLPLTTNRDPEETVTSTLQIGSEISQTLSSTQTNAFSSSSLSSSSQPSSNILGHWTYPLLTPPYSNSTSLSILPSTAGNTFVGTGLVFTGINSSGWNTSVTTVLAVVATPSPTTSQTTRTTQTQISFETDFPTIDIYGPPHPTISKSSLAAQSGFYTKTTKRPAGSAKLTSTTPFSLIIPYTSNANTSATVHGQTTFWGITGTSPTISPIASRSEPPHHWPSSIPAFANSTSPAAAPSSSVTVREASGTPLSSNGTSMSSALGVTISARPSHSLYSALLSSAASYSPFSTSSILSAGYNKSLTSSAPVSLSTLTLAVSTLITSHATSNSAAIHSQNISSAPSSSMIPIPLTTESSNSNSTESTLVYSPTSSQLSIIESSNSFSTFSRLSNIVSSTVVATPTTLGCAKKGYNYNDFILNFDDIPPLVVSNTTNPNSVQPAPVFNPYHQFDFSDGFTRSPPPKEAYNPSSPPLLLEFTPSSSKRGLSGQISSGDHTLKGCFNFNFYGGSFGCDSTGPNCDFAFSGYRYNIASNSETVVTTQTYTVPACPPQDNCTLVSVSLDSTFRNMTHIRINATVESKSSKFWADDLLFGWYDNSCAAGTCRLNSHIR